MELTSKQRAQLRGMANGLDTIVQIGKDGIGDNLVQQANAAREACQELAKRTRSEGVQVIGTKFVLYRESHSREKKDKIVLVKDRKKPTQT